VDTSRDRGFVYQPNTIKGYQPIAIGHQCSFVALLPERDEEKIGNWVILFGLKFKPGAICICAAEKIADAPTSFHTGENPLKGEALFRSHSGWL
jgi:hypothetical protein